MIHNTATHLLVAAGGSGAGQHIISHLQNEGMSVTADTANTPQELAVLLRQPQWEAIVCFENGMIPEPIVLDMAAQYTPALPVILVTSADTQIDLLPKLDQRITDVVPDGQSRRLFLTIQREAVNTRLQRQLASLEKNRAALEARHHTMLSTSANPVAYIHDDTHLYCNHSYASLFGFNNSNDVISTPALNLILPRDHWLIKPLLTHPPATETALAVRAVRTDALEMDVLLTLSPIQFQHKSCLQVIACPLSATAMTENSSITLPDGAPASLATCAQFFSHIETAILNTVQSGISSALLVISLGNPLAVPAQEQQDTAKLRLIFNHIIRFLKDYLHKPTMATHLEADVYGLIIDDAGSDELTALDALIKSHLNNHDSRDDPPAPVQNYCTGHAVMSGREKQLEYVLMQACNHLPAAQQTRIKQQMMKWRAASASNINKLEHLQVALTRNSFTLLYQPVVHIKGANHKIYEVLTRMLDSHGQEILPEAFISVANQNGIGEQLDRLIFSLALGALASAAETGPLLINISSNSLMSSSFLPWLNEQLANHKIPAALCAITISEIDINNNERHAFEFCRDLRAAGLKLVISHFGYSPDPYAILARITPDIIKLDSFLLKDMGKRARQKTTVQTLVANLHQRGLLVVAPQVEALAMLPALWETGIDYVQGYGLQAPSHEMNYNFLIEEEITLSAGRF